MSASSKQKFASEASFNSEQSKNSRTSSKSSFSSRKSLPHFSKIMYSLPIPNLTPKHGESVPRRHPAVVNDKVLPSQYDPEIKTLWDLFEATTNRIPDKDFLGTRTRSASGEVGPFQWQTYSEVKEDVLNIG